jgi:hypothetical protein
LTPFTITEDEARPRRKEQEMRKAFELGGVLAAVVLIAFGITAIVLGVNGRSTVDTSLKQEQITGSPDMTPTAIAGEVAAARAAQTKLVANLRTAGAKITPSPIETPSCSVAGKLVNSGDRARCFARYMRIHTFGATAGLTYAQMGRFTAKPGTSLQFTDGLGGTSDPKYALVDTTTQQPVSNGRRDIWVTYTALTTALNSSYMASQLALFGIVVGVALLLTGIGFAILAIGGALRSPDTRSASSASGRGARPRQRRSDGLLRRIEMGRPTRGGPSHSFRSPFRGRGGRAPRGSRGAASGRCARGASRPCAPRRGAASRSPGLCVRVGDASDFRRNADSAVALRVFAASANLVA